MATSWYLLPGDTLVAASQSWSADQGTPGSATAYGFWNNRGGVGASTLTSLYFRAVAQVSDPETSALVWRDQGVPVLDDHEVEARIVGGLGGKTGVLSTAWTPLGKGRVLVAPDLANDEGLEIEVRVNPTSSSSSDAVVVALRAYSSTAISTSDGLVDAGLGGVLTRVGDGGASYLASFDGLAENPGGADDQVQVGDFVGVVQGRSVAGLVQLVTVSDVDGDATTLAPGESYWVAFSVASDGSITQTKGSKAAADPDQPAFPTTDAPLGYVLRSFDGLIETADIEEVWTLGLYALTVVSGRQVSIASGRSLVDDRLGIPSGSTTLDLDASLTSTIWALGAGTLTATSDGSKPTAKAEALYDVTCDATDVTAIVDRRRLRGSGRSHRLTFTIMRTGGLQVNDESLPEVWDAPSDGEIRLLDPVTLAAHDLGSGLTSGSTKIDILVSEAGGAYTSIYPEAGTDDRRPDVAWDATDPVSKEASSGDAAIPTTRVVGRGTRMIARVVGVPAGTTAPAGMTVVVVIEEVR